MNTPRVAFASARVDFLERVRRYSFLFTLGSALNFGYLATVGKLMLRIGDLRGIYNSAWIRGLLAMVGSTFISLAGFYFVKNPSSATAKRAWARFLPVLHSPDSCTFSAKFSATS